MQNQHYAQEAGVTAPENNPMDTPMVFLQKGPSEHPTKPTEPTGPRMMAAALDLAAAGWEVFPLVENTKRPLTAHGVKDATTDADTIRAWWERNPEANLGLAPGADLLVLDVDTKHGIDGHDTLTGLEFVHGELPPTRTTETPSGGWHLYFKKPPELRIKNRVNVRSGLDVRTLGGYLVAPPSVIDGKPYRWLNDAPMADAPPWLVALVTEEKQPAPPMAPQAPTAAPRGAHDAYTQRAIDRATSDVLSAGPGERNNELNAAAYGLARLAAADRLDWGQVSQALERAAVAAGLALSEVRATLESARGKGSTNPNFEGMAGYENRFKDTAAGSEGSAWPELVPLPEEADDIAAPEEFPFAALGHLLGDAAKAIATDVQAPDAMAGGSVLAAASLAVQPLVDVVLPHGQVSPTSLFLVTGGGSGERKTAVDDVACGEIAQRRKVAARQFHHAMEDYWKERDNHKKGDPEPVEPLLQSLTIGDATAEGVKRLLKGQSSVGVFSAEGGEVLGGHSMKDTNRMAAMAFFLKGWGAEAIDSMRGGEGYTSLLGRRMALHVMAQPILLRQLLSDPLADGQGFLARCLIAQPQSLAGSRFFKGCNPKENPAVLAYSERIGHLLDTRPQCWPEGDGYELKPRQLCLNQEACNLWIEFYNSIEYMQGTGKELEHARAFASKVPEQAARIAGVIAVFNDPQTTQIDESAMFGAMELMKFYLSEHLRLTGKGRQEQHDRRLRELLDWLQKEGPVVPAAAVLQKCPRAVRSLKAKGIAPLLDELARRGYIRSIGKAWEVRNGI